MATFIAIKNRGGGGGALGGVLRYVQQEEKTTWEDRRLVSGWNCTARSVYDEMRLTKEQFDKTDGRQYYHFVQSFDKQGDLSPQEVHAMGLELAQLEFPNFEVLVATHVDTEHFHNHLVVNSVSFQDGKKLHQSAADLQAHRMANDEICASHGLEILPPPQKQVKQKRMSTREYRSAAKGESWKFRLMNTIDQCMRYAATREEFISLMKSEGYEVRWTENRKNITYTTPAGMKCRDNRLHEEKYTKEAMEHEFRIRAAIAHGGVEAEEHFAIYNTAELSQQRGVGKSADDDQRVATVDGRAERHFGEPEPAYRGPHSPSAGGFQPEGAVPHPGADGGTDAGCGGSTAAAATGWEEERNAFLQMAGLASGLRPDRSGQMDRTGTAHRGGTAGDGVWHSDSGQQHPQPVSMKPLHAGLYGLAVTGALLDDGNEDVEERYRRIQAEQEAKNIGAVIGLVAGVAMVLTQDEQSSTEQQWTEDQQAEQTQQQTM